MAVLEVAAVMEATAAVLHSTAAMVRYPSFIIGAPVRLEETSARHGLFRPGADGKPLRVQVKMR